MGEGRKQPAAAVWRLGALWVLAAALAAGCGTVEDPPADDTAVEDLDATDEDGGASDGAANDGTTTDGIADTADGTDDKDAVAAGSDGVGTDATGNPDATGADGSDPGDAGAADAADSGPEDTGEPAKKLPLPDCAKNCTECAKCADAQMCVNGKTYNNDCEAVCDLQAYEWPTGFEPSQGKCPDCKFCKPDEPLEAWCATLKNGAKVTTNAKCETQCLELATDVGTNPTKGPCKSKCSFGVDQGGGGCSATAWQPVCAKQDGNTYQTQCAMDHCDIQGCFPVGAAAASGQCVAGKMNVECPGECYDSKKWSACPNECKPVCAVASSGKGQSFRNGCIANADQAKVLSCEGVSATAKDKCSAELYAGYGGGCCPDVDYAVVKQICASKGEGADALWMTFRSQGEFNCLVGTEKDKWTFQYQGPCICNCPQTDKPVCGDDGLTYQNACQAKCYNGDSFSWKEGACK